MSNIPHFQSHGQDGKPVLLFLHGIGGDNHAFDAQLPAFAGLEQDLPAVV